MADRKNNAKEVTNESITKAFKVHIIGDAHIDIFEEEEKEFKSTNKNNKSNANLAKKIRVIKHGGIHYVRSMLKAKSNLYKAKLDDKNINLHIRYKSAPNEKGIVPSKLKWTIRKFNDNDSGFKAYRCLDNLALPFENASTFTEDEIKSLDEKDYKNDSFKGEYQFGINHDLINFKENNLFLLEHIGGDFKEESSKINNKISFLDENAEELIETLYKTIENNIDTDEAINKIPQFFWILHRKIPEILNANSKIYNQLFLSGKNKSLLFKFNKIKERSVIFIMVNTLRNAGCYISRDVSWERAAQDYMRAYYSNPLLSVIKEFSHVILRFGVNGAIYSAALEEKVPKESHFEIPLRRCVHRLYFDPEAKRSGLYRDPEQDGDLIGYQSLFASCALLETIKYQEDYPSNIDFLHLIQVIGRGIRKSIKCCQTIFDHGFGRDEIEVTKYFHKVDESIKSLLKENMYSYLEIANERIPVENPEWSILKQSAEYHLFEKAVEIVKKDVYHVINYKHKLLDSYEKEEKTLWAPVVKFGDLVVVDRREIESYKAVHSLLSNVMTHKQSKPLSIAVFGPPGSGKSTVVKALIYSVKPDDIDINFKTINMTQITHEELKNELADARKLQDEYRLPVLFFDEFDCSVENTAHGWLKYFLMPMEDWENPKEAKGDRERKGSPIFIFAGGTSYNYPDFSREDGSISQEQRAQFASAKGPDFVSRLRGHINILGPNRVDDDDDAHVIRRAILLRSILKNHEVNNGNQIDDSIIRAMLRVSSFKHGARSMRAVISMCAKLGGENGKIVSSVLPTLPQLNMHVNGKEFIEMIISESHQTTK